MHIHCNEGLLAQFDFERQISEPAALDRHSTILGSWYAGAVHVLGGDFLLYVHTKTLYSTLDLLDFEEPLLTQSLTNLRGKVLEIFYEQYGLTDAQVAVLMQPFKAVTLGHIEDKRMARIIDGIAVSYQKGFLRAKQNSKNGEVRLWELEDEVNGLTRRNLGDASPAETLRQLILSGVN